MKKVGRASLPALRGLDSDRHTTPSYDRGDKARRAGAPAATFFHALATLAATRDFAIGPGAV